MKNILFLVTGKTPQIITETVWALACDPENNDKWIPDEIQILTTTDGIKEVKKTLLGNTGVFKRMCDEYQLPLIQFDESNLHTITDDNNKPLEDLRTPNDNEYAANAICEKIRHLTKDDNTCLYVSIAGGRKTMGFYAGYALSLYGRAQDRMSHVLVSPEFESLRGFFYPARIANQTIIKQYINKFQEDGSKISEEIQLDTFNGKIWLANIPFVRMRHAILPKHQLNPEFGKKFGNIVYEINKSFEPIKLTLFTKNNKRQIQINDQAPIRLSPQYFAMLHWFADKKINQHTGIEAPKIDQGDLSNQSLKEQIAFFKEWSDEYNQFYGKQKAKDDVIVDKAYFEVTKSKLNTTLAEKLGLALATRIMPTKKADSNLFELPSDISIVLTDK